MDTNFLYNSVESWVFALIFVAATIILSRVLKGVFNAIKKNQAKV